MLLMQFIMCDSLKIRSEEIKEEFIDNILSADSSKILASEVDFALDPYAPHLVGEKWQEFTDKLSTQYTSFAWL